MTLSLLSYISSLIYFYADGLAGRHCVGTKPQFRQDITSECEKCAAVLSKQLENMPNMQTDW